MAGSGKSCDAMVFYKSDFKIITKDFFTVLTFVGFVFFIPIIISLVYGEYYIINNDICQGVKTKNIKLECQESLNPAV